MCDDADAFLARCSRSSPCLSGVGIGSDVSDGDAREVLTVLHGGDCVAVMEGGGGGVIVG